MKDFKSRLTEVMQAKVVSRYKLAKACGLSASTVTNWLTGTTAPDRTKIESVSKYLGTTPEWLLEGQGAMLVPETFSSDEFNEEWNVIMASEISGDDDIDLIAELSKLPKDKVQAIIDKIQDRKEAEAEVFKQIEDTKYRPRIPYTAVAGSLTNAVEGITTDQCEQIPRIEIFPDYDFTIIIKGNSMEPKYEGGDEVACKRIDSTSFIQWGKVHVLDTAQGILIKRVYENGDKIRCVSYNSEYPDFSIDKSEIYSMSLVVGLIRL